MFAAMMPAWAKARSSGVIRMFDTDNDGTVDLAEAKAAASKLFDKLERDKDGTLDKREPRLTRTTVKLFLPTVTSMNWLLIDIPISKIAFLAAAISCWLNWSSTRTCFDRLIMSLFIPMSEILSLITKQRGQGHLARYRMHASRTLFN